MNSTNIRLLRRNLGNNYCKQYYLSVKTWRVNTYKWSILFVIVFFFVRLQVFYPKAYYELFMRREMWEDLEELLLLDFYYDHLFSYFGGVQSNRMISANQQPNNSQQWTMWNLQKKQRLKSYNCYRNQHVSFPRSLFNRKRLGKRVNLSSEIHSDFVCRKCSAERKPFVWRQR